MIAVAPFQTYRTVNVRPSLHEPQVRPETKLSTNRLGVDAPASSVVNGEEFVVAFPM